jgi:hypothetical protein
MTSYMLDNKRTPQAIILQATSDGFIDLLMAVKELQKCVLFLQVAVKILIK